MGAAVGVESRARMAGVVLGPGGEDAPEGDEESSGGRRTVPSPVPPQSLSLR